MSDFFKTVRDFLLDYLPNQRNYSEHTVKSYRDALKLLIQFLREKKHLKVKEINFAIFDTKLIVDFLVWLQSTRNITETSRNQRISAIRSFFRYAAERDATLTVLSRDIQDNVKTKKCSGRLVEFFSEEALAIYLAQPDTSTPIGLRNMVLMTLMYDTGARVSEILGLRLCDIRMNTYGNEAYLMGKGRKPRLVSLLPKTIAHIDRYMREFHPNRVPGDDNEFLFYTVMHGKRNPISVDTVGKFMKIYGEKARLICPEVPKRVHPHMMRHTRAMHYYRKGMPLVLLAEYLGHSDVQSTKIYAFADTTMKRDAMIKADPKQKNTPEPVAIWENDEDMILKLAGLK